MAEHEGRGADGHARVAERDAGGRSDIHEQGRVRRPRARSAIPHEQRTWNGDIDPSPEPEDARNHRDVDPEVDERIAIEIRRNGVRRQICADCDVRQAQARRPGRSREVRSGEDYSSEVHRNGILRSARISDIYLDRDGLPGAGHTGRWYNSDSRLESVDHVCLSGVLGPIHRRVHDDPGRVALEHEDAREQPDGLPRQVERRKAGQSIDKCRDRRWVRGNPAIEHIRGNVHALAEFCDRSVDEHHDIDGIGYGASFKAGTDCRQEKPGDDEDGEPHLASPLLTSDQRTKSYGMYSNVLQRRKSSARRLSGGVPDRWLVCPAIP